MSRIDHRTLINLGRKSGLRTSDIYSALTARPTQATDLAADCNGFVPTFDSHGNVAWHSGTRPDASKSAK
jgi:hypothetical protein